MDGPSVWYRVLVETAALSPGQHSCPAAGAARRITLEFPTLISQDARLWGEELAVLLEPAETTGVRSPSHVASFACETLAALLVHGFANAGLLTSSRDEFVHAARAKVAAAAKPTARPLRLFVSTSGTDDRLRMVDMLRDMLENRYGSAMVHNFADDRPDKLGETEGLNVVRDAIEAADASLVIVDKELGYSRRQMAEVDLVQRVSLRSDMLQPIIPIVYPACQPQFFKSKLANYSAHLLTRDKPSKSQLKPIVERLEAQLSSSAALPRPL